ncbi:F-box protein At5g07610-like [Impatiens glandulifera]|uniref:F-box protein At5g07610-like n=1 Tax=Impatiens glandulifera TaxID=253017 RepID=UPI001FB0A262|nr:F-box protein At5g07610-like [Impatiens glandulifera]
MAMSGKAMKNMFVNEDLLNEIFVRLTSKSLVRFKSVSKGWLSLISSPSLILRRRRRRQGLLIQNLRNSNPINFIPLNSITTNNNNHVNVNVNDDDYPDLLFFPKVDKIYLMTSSNGLLFCVGNKCHVLNPTTRQFLTVVRQPNLTHFCLVGLGLIFDPSKSIHYKLVCLWKSYFDFQVEIYSSETKSWKALHHCKSPFSPKNYSYLTFYPAGIYWNDAIIWFPNGNGKSDCLIFDIEKEQEEVRTLPQPNRDQWGDLVFCFGESGGHLYAVEWSRIRSSTKAFRVYEMKEDFSGWLLTKYTGNLSDQIESEFRVLSLVWTDEDKPYLVLDLGFQIVSYNLEEKEDTKINEISGVQPPFFKESIQFNLIPDVHQYVECYSSVSPL